MAQLSKAGFFIPKPTFCINTFYIWVVEWKHASELSHYATQLKIICIFLNFCCFVRLFTILAPQKGKVEDLHTRICNLKITNTWCSHFKDAAAEEDSERKIQQKKLAQLWLKCLVLGVPGTEHLHDCFLWHKVSKTLPHLWINSI